jgi:hypothetical protein
METLLEEALDGCPSLIQEPLKRSLGQAAPEITARRPAVFLKQSPKLVVPKPQEPNISWVVEGMLRASDALEILIVEPIDVCMRIPRVPSSAIDFPSVHDPKVRDNINIGLRNIGGDVRVHKLGNED